MRTTPRPYIFEDSDKRIREILSESEQAFEEVDYIPSSDRLTYGNGYYVNCCTAVFIDIRGSSQLPKLHKRPVLAKMYRAYLSECVAVLNQDENCKEIFIAGDCVSGIFQTKTALDVEQAFYRAGQLNTLINLLNWRFDQLGYKPIRCGIGMDYGRALMLKAGYSGLSINEIIWMGDVVNNASNLCHKGNKDGRLAIQISKSVYDKISRSDYKDLLTPIYGDISNYLTPTEYEGDIVATTFSEWIEAQKNKRGGLAAAIRNAPPSAFITNSFPAASPGLLGLGLAIPTSPQMQGGLMSLTHPRQFRK